MKYLFILLVSILVIQNSVAPPVTKDKKDEENEVEDKEELANDPMRVMEYHRYLKEVVQALESDPDFRAKLEKAEENDILSGKIADELEHVNHNVRTKLDELKRTELERLRHLAINQYELEHGIDRHHLKIPEHVDHNNPHTFEIDDLKKLIAKTTKDLDEADKKRREEFKEYEMHKKFEQEEKLKTLSEEEAKKFENEIHDLEKKHKEHEPLHHPGSKKQLEEVWEKQDHMEQQFDPRTFFFLHDLDGNGVWDQNELKALFIKELDKLYAEGHPEDDLVERAEEMERMREHVIKEADLNKDGLISYEEFLNESKKAEFEQDPGWKPIDEQQIYSEQEYEEYKRQKAREIEQAIARGMSQEHYPAGHPQAGHQQFPPHPNQVPHQEQAQYNQIPQNQQQQHPQQGQYINQQPQQGHFNQMPPQQGQYQQQVPHQQAQFANQIPQQQQQFHPNQQIPQQQNHPPQNQQIPVGQNQFQAQQQFQQVPVAQNTNQVPQQQFQQQNQQPPAGNNINQVPQQVQQNQPSANAAHLSNQQIPVATGQNQQNTQNQVPQQQTHEQIASMNNAQIHQNSPNTAKV
ncbi:nucleobindin-2 isoform X1 [Nasonia vitripennis]|uniref:EF-hand domain-containing protein n=1 Tax=Nasonia vitripennis TaxID=7425 RepID=A0A7M7ITB2_NASVI|nr:nucleobindin-2 isoform X1 [Nasonia vitripennis]XP_016844100.1 nucleobindin-2 isoform X1 [Nasonia vitripennis]XP_016844101.1 nucleobindin-2 isoform X1 [Nasonia vitripennis]